MCRYFLGNKCDKNRNMRKDVKDGNAKKGKKGHKMSNFHEKDGYLHGRIPDV